VALPGEAHPSPILQADELQSKHHSVGFLERDEAERSWVVYIVCLGEADVAHKVADAGNSMKKNEIVTVCRLAVAHVPPSGSPGTTHVPNRTDTGCAEACQMMFAAAPLRFSVGMNQGFG